MSKNLFAFIIFASVLFSCGKADIKTRSYYFPYADLQNSKVYKYQDASDTSKVLYWHFQTQVLQGDTIFTTGIYNKDFVLTSVFMNKVYDEGVELVDMYVNLGDTNTMYKCLIKSGEVFKWAMKPKSTLFVGYAISNSEKTETEEIVTERKFETKKEPISFNGKEYSCLVVRENTLINHILLNRTATEEQERNSYFAEGIGLIQFETYNADATSNIFRLDKILSLDEWKKLIPLTKDSLAGSLN